jgi:hypothetical protein
MKALISQLDFPVAEKIFAISNTSSFLLRKLRDENSIRALAETFTPKQLVAELKRTATKRPKSLSDAVRPYVMLVALSWYSDREPLKSATKIETPHFPWFETIGKDLLNRHSPVSYTKIEIPPRISVAASWGQS